MSSSPLPPAAQRALAEVGARCRVPVSDARLVRQHSTTGIALPSAGLLVRIASNPAALANVTVSVAVTRWLADRAFPCVVPADVEPFLVDGRAVSVWLLLDVADGPPGTGAELGQLLRRLHHQRPLPSAPAWYADPLDSVARATDHHPDAMSEHDRGWLQDRIADLRQAWAALHPALPTGLIHGDAHSNNLLRTRDNGVVLGDWDHVATGPREWDVIQPYYMARRFARHTRRDLVAFADAYGWDVTGWDGFTTLVQLREITGLSPYVRRAPTDGWSRDELAHRLDTLRRGDETAAWSTPSDR